MNDYTRVIRLNKTAWGDEAYFIYGENGQLSEDYYSCLNAVQHLGIELGGMETMSLINTIAAIEEQHKIENCFIADEHFQINFTKVGTLPQEYALFSAKGRYLLDNMQKRLGTQPREFTDLNELLNYIK